AGGLKLSDDVEQKIEDVLERAVENGDDVPTPAEATVAHEARVAVDDYVAYLTAMFPAGALEGLHVVLDCANGATSVTAPAAVRALGARVDVLHAEPDGVNINAACGATAPGSLAAAVVANGADVGLAFDGDGDRVIAIDNRGRIVDGDRLIAIEALGLRERGELTHDTVVVTVMSNLGFHRAMRDNGINVVTTAVGDRYVLGAL